MLRIIAHLGQILTHFSSTETKTLSLLWSRFARRPLLGCHRGITELWRSKHSCIESSIRNLKGCELACSEIVLFCFKIKLKQNLSLVILKLRVPSFRTKYLRHYATTKGRNNAKKGNMDTSGLPIS